MKISSSICGFAFLIGVATQAMAAPDTDCLMPALRAELESKLQYQDDWAALVAQKRPELEPGAVLQAEAAKVGFKRRFSRVVWLFEVAPQRLTTADDIWVISWSDEDQVAWQAASTDHEALQVEFDNRRIALVNAPDEDSLRDFVAASVSDAQFVRLGEAFAARNGQLRDHISSCFEADAKK